MLIQGWSVSLNVLRNESQWDESQTGNEVRKGVLPRCFCWPRSSPQQETAPMQFSLWRWAKNKMKIWIHLLRKRLRICRNEKSGDALTPTILFMASSLSDSLLLSNISLRSSFLWIDNTVTDARCGQYGVRKPKREMASTTSCCFARTCWEGFTCAASVAVSQITEKSPGHAWP